MIRFARYPHISDLFKHYAQQEKRDDIFRLLDEGVKNEKDAECLSQFAWRVAELINEDEENGKEVLGSVDNTDMIPDLSYEITAYMKSVGFYAVWQKVSDQEMR
jgi:hypothetical protein